MACYSHNNGNKVLHRCMRVCVCGHVGDMYLINWSQNMYACVCVCTLNKCNRAESTRSILFQFVVDHMLYTSSVRKKAHTILGYFQLVYKNQRHFFFGMEEVHWSDGIIIPTWGQIAAFIIQHGINSHAFLMVVYWCCACLESMTFIIPHVLRLYCIYRSSRWTASF